MFLLPLSEVPRPPTFLGGRTSSSHVDWVLGGFCSPVGRCFVNFPFGLPVPPRYWGPKCVGFAILPACCTFTPALVISGGAFRPLRSAGRYSLGSMTLNYYLCIFFLCRSTCLLVQVVPHCENIHSRARFPPTPIWSAAATVFYVCTYWNHILWTQ